MANGARTSPSWPAASVRALHPARLLLCAGTLAVSLLLCAMLLAQFAEQPLRLGAWCQQPQQELRHLAEQVLVPSPGTAILRSLLLAAVLAVVWSLAAGWIARAELLHHRAGDAGLTAQPARVTPTRFVLDKTKALCLLLPSSLLVATLFLSVGAVAGLFNRIPFLGTVVVAFALPLVLLFCLFAVFVLFGSPAWFLMPSALAAEGSDSFDALSRGYSYLYQQPLAFALWQGLALAISSLPSVAAFVLLNQQPAPVSPELVPLVWATGTVFSLSLFWTLQPLVYLKLRRLVDDVDEDEIWDDAACSVSPANESGQRTRGRDSARRRLRLGAFPAGDVEKQRTEAEGQESSVGLRPQREQITFRDTLTAGQGFDLIQHTVLLAGVLWAGLVLVAGALIVLQPAAGPAIGPQAIREAVRDLAGREPATLAALLAGVVVIGAGGLAASPARIAARMAAVKVVFGQTLALVAARPFARRTRGRAILSTVLLTAGLQLLLAAGALAPFAVSGDVPPIEVAVLTASAIVLVGLAALGLGALGVEGSQAVSTGAILGNVIETLASAVASLVSCCVRFALLLAVTWTAWLLMCESIAWSGGEHVRWVRWGLDGTLAPESEGGFYRIVSWVAGFWFVLWFGLALVYPAAFALRWGAACYLLARQRAGQAPAEPLVLSDEERSALQARQEALRRRRSS